MGSVEDECHDCAGDQDQKDGSRDAVFRHLLLDLSRLNIAMG
jgi:hypothetical protein